MLSSLLSPLRRSVLLLCCALPLMAAVLSTPAGAAGATFSDPASIGSIGLCNAANQQVTSGSVKDTPLAVKAVSSVAAPSPYNNDSRTAILMAFQPRQGLLPGEWSGQALTASSRYSNPSVPMVQATSGDASLHSFLVAYPANWDGWVQLRMYFGTANAPPESTSYPTLNLKVTGNTWQAVGGSSINCAAGTAVSLENIVLPSTTTATAPQASTTTKPKANGSTTTTVKVTTTTKATSGSTTSTPWIIAVIVIGGAVGAGGTFLVRRRRSKS